MRELNLVKQVNHQMLLLHEITNFDHLFDDYIGVCNEFFLIWSIYVYYLFNYCFVVAKNTPFSLLIELLR